MSAPVALTIAGSDSSGGAGIQADLKTFSALGVYGASAITALTAQNTRGVQAIHDVPAAFVAAQMASVFADLAVGAVKIGMLGRTEIIDAVEAGLDKSAAGLPVVLDPVMIATSGHRLVAADAVAALRGGLMRRADLVTPNLPELAALLDAGDGGEAADEAEAVAQGQALRSAGARAVLVKGGHGSGPESVDFLIGADGSVLRLAAPRIATRNTHGTGCTLAAAITAGLARGLPLQASVEAGKAYLGAALAAADRLGIGGGHGPVHHFHAVSGWENT